jgi:hypothetical protein
MSPTVGALDVDPNFGKFARAAHDFAVYITSNTDAGHLW